VVCCFFCGCVELSISSVVVCFGEASGMVWCVGLFDLSQFDFVVWVGS